MQFEYDPENLILAVKNRPGLWDCEHPEYRDRKVRVTLWSGIVQELMQEDVMIHKNEMRELELQLQIKWKSLRDRFIKYLGNPKERRRPYVYANQMQFLLSDKALSKRINAKEVASAGSGEDDDDDHRPVWKSRKKIKVVHNDSTDNCSDGEIPFRNEVFVCGGMENEETVLKEEADTDKMFLMSLLPHLKSIPTENQLNAKTEIMQVLQRANEFKIV